ncbi:hypothetical protein E2320_022125 [Naja naja]|nr:hypothetical protein E2320_022125 [Naja naja]
MAQLTQWFWRQEYWLPPGITWEDMQDTEDIRYPQPHHLLLCFPIALLLIALRFLFYRQVLAFCSFSQNQTVVRRKPSPNLILEAFYTKWRKNPQKEEVSGLAKQCDLPTRQVERWFRYRLNQNRPSVTKKFCEARSKEVLVGWYDAIPNERCLLAETLVLEHPRMLGWPLHLSLYGYYLLQFSFYWTLVITMPFDIKQRDFNALIVHHVTAILLSGFSYCVNFIPIGSLVMILHDAPDTLMHVMAFLFARTIFFPYKILHSTFYHLAEVHEPYFGYYFFNTLLMLVYVLNVLWSSVIILMLYRLLTHGKVRAEIGHS